MKRTKILTKPLFIDEEGSRLERESAEGAWEDEDTPALSPGITSVAEDRASLNLTTTLEKQRQLHLVKSSRAAMSIPRPPTVMD